ncbi:MAG: class I SAM-dependent methyltransferase [Candidatus Heimdallarchaeota archaeon]|nr:MAG: class I SAM-dependent methyltransferase [Candidatus Heimdallarchaeota archaeon]
MRKDYKIQIDRDQFRERLNKYTRKAFKLLPELDEPRILDIGCGTGIPTIELAKLSNGKIIGIDIDQSSLDKLNRKIDEEGFSHRIKTNKCSLFEIEFPDESFDLIWVEGAIYPIGFERGLREWKRLIRGNGFLVVHDEKKGLSSKLKKVSECGYELLNHFSLPMDAWWTEYYKPLETRIKELHLIYKNAPEALKALKKDQEEIEKFKKNPKEFVSVFFIMKKLS